MVKCWEVREFRLDLRSGIVAAVIAESHRDPKKRAEPFSALEFMPLQKDMMKRALSPELEAAASASGFAALARRKREPRKP